MPAGSALWVLLEPYGVILKEKYWKKVGRLWWLASAQEVETAIRELVGVGRAALAVDTAGMYCNEKKIRIDATSILNALSALRDELTKVSEESPIAAETRALTNDQMFAYHLVKMFEVIDMDQHIKEDMVVVIEIFFLPFLRHTEHAPKRLQHHLARSPEFFAQLVSFKYKPRVEDGDAVCDNTEAPVPDNDEEQVASRYHMADTVLSQWKLYPGVDEEGPERDRIALDWAREALRLTKTQHRRTVGEHEIGYVFARMPEANDGVWPSLAARILLEEDQHPEISEGLHIGRVNQRGVVSKAIGEGGKQEREIASSYRKNARQLQAQYPRTAALLDGLARDYEREAERDDSRERRREY